MNFEKWYKIEYKEGKRKRNQGKQYKNREQWKFFTVP
jgi:hypothetical protein